MGGTWNLDPRTALNLEPLSRLRLLYEIVFTWHLLIYLAELGWSLCASLAYGEVAGERVAFESVIGLLLALQLWVMVNRPGQPERPLLEADP